MAKNKKKRWNWFDWLLAWFNSVKSINTLGFSEWFSFFIWSPLDFLPPLMTEKKISRKIGEKNFFWMCDTGHTVNNLTPSEWHKEIRRGKKGKWNWKCQRPFNASNCDNMRCHCHIGIRHLCQWQEALIFKTTFYRKF